MDTIGTLAVLQSWAEAIGSLPHKAAITAVCGVVFFGTLRLWHTPQPDHDVLRDNRAFFAHVVKESIQNVVFFGVATFLVVLWNWPLATVAFVGVGGLVFLAEVPGVVLGCVGAPLVFRNGLSHGAWSLAALSVKLASFAIGGLYLALAWTAWRM